MQSNGKTSLTRIELEYKGDSYEFSINPQELSVSYKNRVGVTQTLGGHWVDKYGTGLPEITFSGVTGYKLGKEANEGYNKYKELKQLIQTVFNTENNLRANQDVAPMRFYNFTDEDYWDIIPTDFSVQRSVANPLMFRYSFKAYGIKNMDNPTNSIVPTNTGGIMDGTLGKDIANSHKELYNSIASKYSEIREKENFANLIKEKIPFSQELSQVIQNIGVTANLGTGEVGIRGNLSAGGVKLPFNMNNKKDSNIGLNIEDTGTILDCLSMLTGTNGNSEVSPLLYNYSIGGISLSGISTKHQQYEESSEYLNFSTEVNYNSKSGYLTTLYNSYNSGDFKDIDYSSYIVGEKNSENLSSILSQNYKKYDSILQYSSIKAEAKLLEEEKKQLYYILINSIAITSNSMMSLKGSELTVSEDIIVSQIAILEDFIGRLRDKKYTDLIELIQSLEQLNLSYKSLRKMKFFGGEEV